MGARLEVRSAGKHAEKRGGNNRDEQGRQEHAAVGVAIERERQIRRGGKEGRKRPGRPSGEQHGEPAAGQREQEALHQELA